MAGFPDIRLYKSNYKDDEAKKTSTDKGSVVFSSKTKRIYVDGLRYCGDVDDISWKHDTTTKNFSIDIKNVETAKSFSIIWSNTEQAAYTLQNGKKTKVVSIEVDASKLLISKDIYAKNLKTQKDEKIISKNTDINTAVQILAREFENKFIWLEYSEN